MNDLITVDRLGPAPTALSVASLDAARARLDAAIIAVPGRGSGRRSRRRIPLLAASVAAAVGLALTPALVGTDDSVALAATDPMTFPWTPTAVPRGLGEPVFERDMGIVAARYGARLNGVSILTDVDDEDYWAIPGTARATDVNGQDATVYNRTVHDGTRSSAPAVTVVWHDESNEWTAVTGSGEYADPDRIVAFAESLRYEPQPVDLSLGLAPRDWSVAAYKEDRILTLSETGDIDGDSLTVALLDRASTDLSPYGAQEESTVTVNGRPAAIGRQASEEGEPGWILVAATPHGQPFSLQAPPNFNREQVLRVAESVTYRP